MNDLMVWFRGNRSLFPREIGKHYLLNNEDRIYKAMAGADEFIRYVHNCQSEKLDCYASIFSLKQIENDKYDTVLLDIDVSGATTDVVDMILHTYGYKIRRYVSGRGHHIYVDFPETYIPDYGLRIRVWAKTIGIYDFVDKKVLGDKKRIARVPRTYNHKNGKLVELECNEGIGRNLAEDLLSLDVERKIENNHSYTATCSGNRLNMTEFPDCVFECAQELVDTGYIDHDKRMFLGTYLLASGMSVKEVVDVFSCADDFDVEYSTKLLQWFKDNQYKPFKCDTLIEKGMCPKKCALYPYPMRN